MITINLVSCDLNVDICVDVNQVILETLEILSANGYPIYLDQIYLTNTRNMKKVNVMLTYKEASIFFGDKLSF